MPEDTFGFEIGEAITVRPNFLRIEGAFEKATNS